MDGRQELENELLRLRELEDELGARQGGGPRPPEPTPTPSAYEAGGSVISAPPPGGQGQPLPYGERGAVDATGLAIENIPVLGPMMEKGARGTAAYFKSLTKGTPWRQEYETLGAKHGADVARYEKEHPALSTAAELGGSMLLPFGAGARAAGMLPAMGRAVGTTGTAALDAYLRDQDVAKAAGTAGALSTAAEAIPGVGRAIGKIGGKLKGFAEERALKAALGSGITADIRRMRKAGLVSKEESKAGRALLTKDEAGPKIVTALPPIKPEDALPAIEAKREYFGKGIGKIGEEIDKYYPEAVSGKAIAGKITELRMTLPDVEENFAIREMLKRKISDFKQRGKFSFKDAQELKNVHRWSGVDVPAPGTLNQREATNKLNRIIGDEMVRAADEATWRIGGSFSEHADLIKKYREYKKGYQVYNYLLEAAEKSLDRSISRRFTAPSDKAFGGAVGMASAIVKGDLTKGLLGIPAEHLHKIGRERGAAIAANVSDALGSLLSNPLWVKKLGPFATVLRRAAGAGKGSLALTHYLLSRNDPEYNALINKVLEEKGNEGD